MGNEYSVDFSNGLGHVLPRALIWRVARRCTSPSLQRQPSVIKSHPKPLESRSLSRPHTRQCRAKGMLMRQCFLSLSLSLLLLLLLSHTDNRTYLRVSFHCSLSLPFPLLSLRIRIKRIRPCANLLRIPSIFYFLSLFFFTRASLELAITRIAFSISKLT